MLCVRLGGISILRVTHVLAVVGLCSHILKQQCCLGHVTLLRNRACAAWTREKRRLEHRGT